MRKLIAGLAGLALALTIGVTPAQAADPHYEDCPPAAFCVYDGSDWTGQWGWKTAGQVNQMPYNCWRLPQYSFNDKLSVAFNRTGSNFRIYEHDQCTGEYVYSQTSVGGTITGMWGANAWMNNKASSIWLALP